MKGDKGRTAEERFFEFVHPEPNSGCWLWDGHLNANGYGKFGYKGENGLAHRASYDMFVAPIPEGLHVLHRCDVPCCVNPEHLFPGTQDDNVKDMEQKKRSHHPGGVDHGRAKLTEDDVRNIRADARSQNQLARLYGVIKTNIRAIKRREIWKHVL
jgi:hypothetical protein